MSVGPQQPHSEQVHAEKYRDPGETFSLAMQRIATGLADNVDHWSELEAILKGMRFMPAGRVQAAIGSKKNITPYNCFVAGTIHDSFVHGSGNAQDSIMDIAKQAATTMRMGGGIGYDWSTLRPSGAAIHGVRSTTDGPMAFMPIMDAVCKATSSAGNRRGAQMGVLRVDHPDIRKFIHAKNNTDQLTGFNLSIAVTDEFMECLELGKPFPLRFQGNIEDYVLPDELWEQIMRSTWDWAEPGVLFIDTINRMNNLWYCETIAATNPCGEQPLPPHGACLLGSFNLTKYIRPVTKPTQPAWAFDMNQLMQDVPAVVRAMDNVVDYASYPLLEQEQEAKSKRRMGLGITGLANAAEALGFPYGSPTFLQFERTVLTKLNEAAYLASVGVARDKGAFPLFDATHYCDGHYIKRTLPSELRAEIRKHGIRNSHLTSIAPTGTISYCADNISSGLEPVFMYDGQRKMKTMDGDVIVDVQDYGVREFGVYGKTADKVTAQEHVEVLAVASQYVDSAVSKTCNVSPDMAWDDFKNIYVAAYNKGCKGVTTFNPAGKRMGILIAKEEPKVEEGASCTIDPATGRRSCE